MKLKELFFLLLLVLPATFALWHPGFFGASDDLHIAWLQQLDQALKMGQFPPRYVPDLSYGFGYPLFNFVFPLPYYLGEIFHIIGFSFVYSVKAVFIFSLLASAITMFWLLKYFGRSIVAMAGAVLYTYTPYRSNDIYNRGAIGEALAFVFLPLLTLSVLRAFDGNESKRMRWIGVGGLSVTGLILTHNIVSYMTMPFVFLLALMLLKKITLKSMLLFIIGLMGCVYFWLPALLDSSLMKYDTVFNFIDHFPTLRQLVTPYWGYGASVPGPYDGMSFFIGEVNLLVIALTFIYFVWKYKKLNKKFKSILFWSFGVLLVCLVMMNFRSTLLWQKIPLLPYFQFPWRFLTLVTFVSSLMVIIINRIRFSFVISLVIIALSIGLNYSRFKPHDFLLRYDDYFLNRYIPVPTPSKDYQQTQEEYLRLPKTTSVRPNTLYPRVFPPQMVSNLVMINSLDASFDVTVEKESTELNYNKYLFPGWYGKIENLPLVLKAGVPFGQIQFTVPAGKHHISINYQETSFRLFLDIVSLVTLFIGIGCLFL